MNIDDIKKNRLWFYIVGGIIFVIVFYFCIVNPFRLKNFEKIQIIESVLTRLERYEKKGISIHNEKWIEKEKDKLEEIRNVQLEYKSFYKERDNHLEKLFITVYGEEINDEALWENRYTQSVNALLDKIEKQHISLSENALPFKRWKLEIPTREEIALEQKRFWIVEELINIILKKELQADYLKSINFEKENVVKTNTNTNLYDVIPFTLKVSMNAENLLFLINEILKSKICFEIKAINISGELYRLRSQEMAGKHDKFIRPEQNRKIQSSSTVDVVFKAEVLDFNI